MYLLLALQLQYIPWLNIRTVCVLTQFLHSAGLISMADGNNVTKGLFWGHRELLTKTSIKAEPQLPENIECKSSSNNSDYLNVIL